MHFERLRRQVFLLSLCLVLISSVSCIKHVGYPMGPESILVATRRMPLRIAVAKLEDVRPRLEFSAQERRKAGFIKSTYYTNDQTFAENDIAYAATEALAAHLVRAGLFTDVQMANFNSAEYNAMRLDPLRRAGRDAVLIGKLAHYWGYNDTQFWTSAGIGIAISFLITPFLAYPVVKLMPNEVEAMTELTDVRLLDVRTGKALWAGGAKGEFAKTVNWDRSNAHYANESLKLAVEDLVTKLQSVGVHQEAEQEFGAPSPVPTWESEGR